MEVSLDQIQEHLRKKLNRYRPEKIELWSEGDRRSFRRYNSWDKGTDLGIYTFLIRLNNSDTHLYLCEGIGIQRYSYYKNPGSVRKKKIEQLFTHKTQFVRETAQAIKDGIIKPTKTYTVAQHFTGKEDIRKELLKKYPKNFSSYNKLEGDSFNLYFNIDYKTATKTQIYNLINQNLKILKDFPALEYFNISFRISPQQSYYSSGKVNYNYVIGFEIKEDTIVEGKNFEAVSTLCSKKETIWGKDPIEKIKKAIQKVYDFEKFYKELLEVQKNSPGIRCNLYRIIKGKTTDLEDKDTKEIQTTNKTSFIKDLRNMARKKNEQSKTTADA